MADFNKQNTQTAAAEAAEAQSSQSNAMIFSIAAISDSGEDRNPSPNPSATSEEEGEGDGDPIAIHKAAFSGNAKRVRALLARRPELLTAEDDDGNTALDVALQVGRQAVWKAVLEFAMERMPADEVERMLGGHLHNVGIFETFKKLKEDAVGGAREGECEARDTATLVDDFGFMNLIMTADLEILFDKKETPPTSPAESRGTKVNIELPNRPPHIVNDNATVVRPFALTADLDSLLDKEETPPTSPVGSRDTKVNIELTNRPPHIVNDNAMGEMPPTSPVRSRGMKVDNESPNRPPHIANNYVIAKSMERKIYVAADRGDLQFFKTSAFQDLECSISNQLTPLGRTMLHIAAVTSNSDCGEELVTQILQRWPNLLMVVDNTGDTALHLAADAGNLATVKALVKFAKETGQLTTLLTLGNAENEKNSVRTALHVALKNYSANGSKVARFIASEFPMRFRDSSLLYMAAMSGDSKVVKMLLEKDIVMSEESKSPIHAAIRAKNLDILDAILSKDPSLMNKLDKSGRRPLSFAAQYGNLDSVCYILDKFTYCAYEKDNNNNGSFPIHAASSSGHREIISEFLQRCLDTCELRTHKQRNILHVAAEGGRARVVKYLLERKDELGKKLANEGDEDGDTPLHLASKYWRPKVVSLLTWDKRVRLDQKNKHGFTALDCARESLGEVIPFRQRLTVTALKSAGVPKSITYKNTLHNCEPYKARVNTLLLVATLVATVTFACSFTLPGGNDNDSGAAKLLSKPMFQAFLICNTISLYSSISAVVVLIAAQLEDAGLILTALKVALPLIGLALATMSFAFIAGVHLAARRLEWLAMLLLAVGSTFTIMLVVLYLQLCARLASRNPILRYVFYHTFCLMVWATGSDNDTKKK